MLFSMNRRKVRDDVLTEAVAEIVAEMVAEDPSLAEMVAVAQDPSSSASNLPKRRRLVIEISDADLASVAGEAFADEFADIPSGKVLIHGLGGAGKVLHRDLKPALKTGVKLASTGDAALDADAGRNQRIIVGLRSYSGRLTRDQMPRGPEVPRKIRGNKVDRLPGSQSWSRTADRLRAVAAQRLLLQLEEKRAVAAADAAGRSQVEIARDLGVSQPTVHRLLRQLAADPAVLQRGPLEVIAAAVMGVVDRETMLIELAALDPKPGESPPDAEADGYVLGAWDEVVDAWERGWLKDDEYEYLARR